MKFRVWVIVVTLGWLVLGDGFGVRVAAKELQAATSQAGVAATDNQVQKSLGKSQTWQNCQVGDILQAGDRIKTGKNSSASLLLADQSVMRIGSGTELEIVDLTEQENGCLMRRFQLRVGRVFADVTPGAPTGSVYEVKGPNAVAAVHGTAFELDTANPGGTDVKVWDGSVDCRGTAPDAKSELVAANSTENQFRADTAGKYERLHFSQEHADAWQTENWKTRQAWRRMTPGMSRRLTFTKSTFQQFQRAHFQMTPRQRMLHQNHLNSLMRNSGPGRITHPAVPHPLQRRPYQQRYQTPQRRPVSTPVHHPRRRFERER